MNKYIKVLGLFLGISRSLMAMDRTLLVGFDQRARA